MKTILFSVAAGIVALALAATGQAASPKTAGKSAAETTPRLLLSDGRDLARQKKLFKTGDKKVVAKVKELRALADKFLKHKLYSVVHNKPRKPRGSSSHDYVSLSIYSWPNPKTKDGLPYILIDGKKNRKEADRYDANLLTNMSRDVQALALAYYLTDEEKYAKKAAEMLSTWFLNPAKRMNPNMNYSGFQPGVRNDKGNGLTDARHLTRIIDCFAMLQHSKAWTKANQNGITKWYKSFLNWLLTSELGKKEANAINNHATYYDVDVVAIALFVGDKGRAKAVLQAAKKRIIDKQIAKDGSQPAELKRPNSLGYSLFNLDPLFDLATLGKTAGVDLWNYHAKNSGGIRKALDFLTPYLTGKKKWTHPQKDKIKYDAVALLLRRAANAYKDRKYEQMIKQIPGGNKNLKAINGLLYPARAS